MAVDPASELKKSLTEQSTMKLLAGLTLLAGLVLASAGQAQTLASSDVAGPLYAPVSDLDGPYMGAPYPEMPPPPPPVREYGYRDDYRYGPPVMPPQEIYAVLRENGFSPLSAPSRRGYIYTIAAVDSAGEDGRLVIDGRNGRILDFRPAGPGLGFGEDPTVYRSHSALPPIVIRGVPRPPAPIPRVASRRSIPVPRPAPFAARSAVAPLQTATMRPKSAEVSANSRAAGTVGEARPAPSAPSPQIRSTQPMPPVQGLD
jgi:hypothetical protein